MDSIAYFLNYYFYLGIPMFLVNIVLTRLKAQSFTEAAEKEAVRCGASASYVAVRGMWHNMAYSLFFWPVGVAHTLLKLIGK